MARRYILVSMNDSFVAKFMNMINNMNRVNGESNGIKIESDEIAAVPKQIDIVAVPKGGGNERS